MPKKLNSYKANLNRYRKCFWLELVVSVFIKNSNNKPIVYRKWLIKGRYNPFTYKLILINNNGTREITVDNGKSP